VEAASSGDTSGTPSVGKPLESFAGARVTVFLPANLHAWLRAEASADGLRVSTYVRRLVIADRNAKRGGTE
jgi:hypothetical protein